MTRALCPLVQTILFNLNEIRGKVLHTGKSPVDTVNKSGEARRSGLKQGEKNREEIAHELRLSEGEGQDQSHGLPSRLAGKSRRRDHDQKFQYRESAVIRHSCSKEGRPLSKGLPSKGPN